MEKIEVPKGFKTSLSGLPDTSMIRLSFPPTIGLSAGDIPHIRPKLLVKEGEVVKTGTPLFSDKRDRSILYVSPATGRVKHIRFGERRRLLEVVIAAQSQDDFIEFDPVAPQDLAKMSKEILVERLKQGGLWQGLRQFPAKDTADPDHSPAMIIVSLNGNDLFSPHPALLLEKERPAFEMGLRALELFSHRIIVTARESSMKKLKPFETLITHRVNDSYPAWDPGAVLYQIKQTQAENTAWCISLEHLIMIGNFLATGRFPIEKMVTVTKPGDKRPHMLTRQGVPIQSLMGSVPKGSLITTGQFNGRVIDRDSHLGFFENTVNVIEDINGEEMFGFMRPGLDKISASSTFLSALIKRPMPVDCTLHGELRACINCSYCEKICPNDLMPNFIMKALEADEVEEALELGLLDCCGCGLCSFTCPSKIELTQILSDGMDSHHKDKE